MSAPALAGVRPPEGPGPALSAIRARFGLVALLLVLAGVGWWWTADQMQGMDNGPWTGPGGLGWFLGVWVVMMAAMMFPSVAPTVALYSRMTRQRSPLSPLLFASGYLGSEFFVPFWVVLAAHAAMGLGTLAGGWRIVRTMGMGITKLKPVGGFCAETAGAVMLLGTAVAGIPVSTTHTITGAIVGVGATTRLSAVRWGLAGRIVWAWVLTIPATALIAAGVFLALDRLH